MGAPSLTKRDAALIAAYESGDTLREAGRRFGLSMQRAHQIISQNAPASLRRVGSTKAQSFERYVSGVRALTRDRDLPAVGSFGGC